MTELGTLINKRAVIKGRLTRFQNLVESISNTNDSPELPKGLVQLPMRIETTQPLLDEFNLVQFQIESLQGEENYDVNDKERDSFENIYYTSMQTAKNLLARRTPFDLPIHENKAVASTPLSSVANLPKIDIPVFKGEYLNWLGYRDTFNSLIHSNNSITNIQKFHYLKASLKGNASNVIESIEFSEANYVVAWRTLLDRYDDKWLIVYNHIKAIFNLSSLTKENSNLLRQLHEDLSKHLHSLKILGLPVDHWDVLLIYIIVKKLDPASKREWEAYKYDTELPKTRDILTFLKDRCKFLEKLNESSQDITNDLKIIPKASKIKNSNLQSFVSNSSVKTLCSFCKQNSHTIYKCDEFLKLPIGARINEAKTKNLCINCLRENHFVKNCKSLSSCKQCSKRHNTLLHLTENSSKQDAAIQCAQQTTVVNHVQTQNNNQILLPTAILRVSDKFGKLHTCRALLDSASQSNFITENLSARLDLQRNGVKMAVTGINQITTNLSSQVALTFHSNVNSYNANITCIVISQITGNLPAFTFDKSNIIFPRHLKLADNYFNNTGSIDVLLGAQIFFDLICIGQIKLTNSQLTLQKTKLGWVFSGLVGSETEIKQTSCNFSTFQDDEVSQQLNKFWNLEECFPTKILSREERFCDEHFVSNKRRAVNGRFIVSLPLKGSPNELGESKQTAIRRFYSLERKLQINPHLKREYISFMQEYEALGHMSKVSHESNNEVVYYLPHHCVIKENSLTTKLRVVFDGSAKTTTGLSINDLQMVGPVVQDDLFSILIRFRKHAYVISADIEKMYRQVEIEPSQRDLQRIVYRENISERLHSYTLNTVTYGTASASFLAIRSLQQLGRENIDRFPQASSIILQDFYVDDLLTGSSSIQDAIRIRKEITDILSQGCFKLRKWTSNEPLILEGLGNSLDPKSFDLASFDHTNTLGLTWLPKTDTISYNIQGSGSQTSSTKRTILSSIASIFDPLGLFAPSIIIPKIILQKLWQYKLTWDESLPSDLHTQWLKFQNELPCLKNINISRLVIPHNTLDVELHGFCDACQSGYGGCIYVRCKTKDGKFHSRLLCAKSRVAPLKSISIPRLELCGALLLARLMAKVCNSLKLEFKNVYCWSDSTVAISWIMAPSTSLKIFVGNRTNEIQELIPFAKWRYIKSSDNPADTLSRGLMPNLLVSLDTWWSGPKWLSLPESCWTTQPNYEQVESSSYFEEFRKPTQCLVSLSKQSDLFEKFSSLKRLQNCVAYCLRFKTNALRPLAERNLKALSLGERHQALVVLARLAQRENFSKEFDLLFKSKPINKNSKLVRLNPFLDNDGLIRVGGRLQNSNLDYDKKHPIVLPKKHRLTYLILKYEHFKILHPGPQQLLASIRERYWPISGRNLAKRITRECLTCFKINPTHVMPLMGSLPKDRITPAPPFNTSGVDYCGPVLIKHKIGRGGRTSKAYICIFICFTVKAIHIELVNDLTTESFIAALKRFVARRGKPSKIVSDNAKNFVGASAELKTFLQTLRSNEKDSQFENFLRDEGIDWGFIPPRSPHFGGLWEASVKTVKHHLRRVLGNALLTFEGLYTCLVQIEAVVNSRPISPLSCDPSDLNPLTPAHFLIGRSLMPMAEPNYIEVKQSLLSRFQRIQQIVQHFWHRWSREYLHELQQRNKWLNKQEPFKIGMMVLLRDENSQPMKWLLGRIVSLHAGAEGVTRVADVKTVKGVYKRAVIKLCPLPLQ